MYGLNKCEFIGHVGKDPDIKYTATGKCTAKFSLAVANGKTADGQELTEWVRFVAWEKLAENVVGKYVFKGSKLYVEGRMQTRKWVDDSGQNHSITEFMVKELFLLDGKGKDQTGQLRDQGASNNGGDYEGENEDEIPF